MACPICGGRESEFFAEARDEEFFTSNELFRYRRCPTCGSVYIDPPPVNQLEKIYPANYYSFDGWNEDGGGRIQAIKESLDVRNFRRLLDTIPGDALSALDVGGGSGWGLAAASGQGQAACCFVCGLAFSSQAAPPVVWARGSAAGE